MNNNRACTDQKPILLVTFTSILIKDNYFFKNIKQKTIKTLNHLKETFFHLRKKNTYSIVKFIIFSPAALELKKLFNNSNIKLNYLNSVVYNLSSSVNLQPTGCLGVLIYFHTTNTNKNNFNLHKLFIPMFDQENNYYFLKSEI